MVVIPFAGTAVIGAILVLIWAGVTRTPLREIGLVRPRSWARAVVVGCLFGVAFKVVMKAFVMPLFGAEPEPRLPLPCGKCTGRSIHGGLRPNLFRKVPLFTERPRS